MKKVVALLTAVLMLAIFAVGCSETPGGQPAQPTEAPATQAPAPETAAPTQAEAETPTPAQAEPEPPAEKIKVALSGNFLSHEFQQRMIQGMKYIAERDDIDFMVADANGDIAKQIADIEGFIASEIDILLVKPVDVNGLDDVVAQCNAKNIPVITQGEVIEGMTAAGALNHTLDGGTMAEYAYNYFQENGVDEMVILSVNFPELPTIVELENGFESKLKELGANYKMIRVNGKGMMETSLQVSTDALTANQDINCVFGINDDSALGAYQAFSAAGADTSKVLFLTHGIEGNAAGKAIMEDKINLAGFAMFPEYYAINFFTTGIKAFKGEPVSKFAWYASFMIDKDNYSQYYSLVGTEYTADFDVVTPLLEKLTEEAKAKYPDYTPPT